MATISIPARTINATEYVSPATPTPAGLQSAVIAMTSCPEWGSAAGWFSWGIEASFDGGASWGLIVSQGYEDPHQLAIGALGKGGSLPRLVVDRGIVLQGALVRAKAKTDGATLTCAFQVTTAP